MKLTTALLLITFIQALAGESYSQTTLLSLNTENSSVGTVLKSLEDNSEFYFLYSPKMIDVERKVSVDMQNKRINNILDLVFQGTDVRYVIKDRQIVLSTQERLEMLEEAEQPTPVTGKVTDKNGEPIVGVTVMIKGTNTGTITAIDGTYSLANVPEDGVLVFSFVGMKTAEVPVEGRTTIDVSMELDAMGLDEVVVVGYGTKKKINLTGAVSTASKEQIENRPVANVQQALQGIVPNLQITTSEGTGEPGAEMNMNIRGLTSIEGTNTEPYVLVDGIPMGINDIDPNDIESISVLKDVASSSIYGARAAYGVILITTKSGKATPGVKVSYATNYGLTNLINMPRNADALSFAHTMNYSTQNAGGNPYWGEQELQWIEQNVENPGSAPEISPTPDGLRWNAGPGDGMYAHASTDWYDVMFRDYGHRQKHNISVSGGGENVNFYLSGGFYDELGLLEPADDYFKRYNIDAKIETHATSWMDISFLAKYKNLQEEFPTVGWADQMGRSFIMMLMTRVKPTMPLYFPGTKVSSGRLEGMKRDKTTNTKEQLVFSPRITLTPIKGWVTNIELNYRKNDNFEESNLPRKPSAIPDGQGGSIVQWGSLTSTWYRPRSFSNTYLSPNIYSTYTTSIGRNNFNIMTGYQQETYSYNNLLASARHLLNEDNMSISTAVGEKLIDDQVGHWGTQGVFGRFGYDFDEKYLLEFNFRYDGSSRFEPDDRWGFFPSFSAGWVISKENFYPLKGAIEFLKLRGSYGSIGNQDVANYLYVPVMGIYQPGYMFGGEKVWAVGTPDITSINLTWEKVSTLDFGFDLSTLDNRLGLVFDWYESKTFDLVGPGQAVPALLGTSVPKENLGEITTRGWEVEISWRNRIGDFAYGITGVLSDYMSEVTKYTNPTKLLNTYYEGMQLGEIWGMETAGLYQSEDDVANYPIDQTFIYSGTWNPGDMKYVDQNGDGVIDIGDNTKENPGDKKILGNSTPRYQFGINLNASWKGIDLALLFQGIGKRDLDIRGLGTFRGPANGPLHANVYEEHLDYWRDDTHPLGANPDAYYPRPYAQYIGQNGKNYNYPTDRYLQNGAYIRLKNIQLGYTIPSRITEKVRISNARVYLSGENVFTFTDLMLYDPEAYNGRYGRIGDQYPLSRALSSGLNVNF